MSDYTLPFFISLTAVVIIGCAYVLVATKSITTKNADERCVFQNNVNKEHFQLFDEQCIKCKQWIAMDQVKIQEEKTIGPLSAVVWNKFYDHPHPCFECPHCQTKQTLRIISNYRQLNRMRENKYKNADWEDFFCQCRLKLASLVEHASFSSDSQTTEQ